MKVLLHADGGKGVGLGHASRCIALSSALRRAGFEALVAVDPDVGLDDYLHRHGCIYHKTPATPEELKELAGQFKANVIVIDSYRFLSDEFHRLSGSCKIVCFDDEAIRELPVDAVINGAPSAQRLKYSVPKHTQLWLGTPYQVIREEFRNIKERSYGLPVSKIIALVGGDDRLNLLPSLANELETLARTYNHKFTAELICGPFSGQPAMDPLSCVQYLRSPTDLAIRMMKADIAISASGQTLYELSCCGTPTIAFCSGQDQVHNLAALVDKKIVLNAGYASKEGWLREVSTLTKLLIEDSALREFMSREAMQLIDGLGADRLVEAIKSLVISKAFTTICQDELI